MLYDLADWLPNWPSCCCSCWWTDWRARRPGLSTERRPYRSWTSGKEASWNLVYSIKQGISSGSSPLFLNKTTWGYSKRLLRPFLLVCVIFWGVISDASLKMLGTLCYILANNMIFLSPRVDSIIADLVTEKMKTQNVNDELDQTFELFVAH